MSLFKSGNPAFSEKNFQTVFVGDNDHAMTLKGTLNNFGFMLLMLLGTAYYSWKEFAGGGNVMPLMWTGLIGGFVLAIVIMATAGIAVFYLLSMILRMFGIDMAFLHEGSLMGIGFSLVVVVIASLNLILDFDRIEQGAAAGAPKYMEWYGAFGLMVTIVWLYLEILRLLSKLSSRK